MTIVQAISKLKQKYLFKQVLRFYPESEEIMPNSTLGKYYMRWRVENKMPYWCDNKRCMLHTTNPLWNGKKITLMIDHIDSNKRNWRDRNLRLLCPNCHTQSNSIPLRNKISRTDRKGEYVINTPENQE